MFIYLFTHSFKCGACRGRRIRSCPQEDHGHEELGIEKMVSDLVEILIKCQGNTQEAGLMVPKNGAVARKVSERMSYFAALWQTKLKKSTYLRVP